MVCRKTIRFLQKAGKLMRPRPSSSDLQGDLFKVELETLLSPEHPLVRLAGQIDWAFFERQLGPQFCETNGAPAKPVLGRNFLLCKLGDKLNAILCACGHNLRLMLNQLRRKAGRRLVFVLLRWLVGWLERLPLALVQSPVSCLAPAGIGF